MNQARLARMWLALAEDHTEAALLITSDAFYEEGREDISHALQWCAQYRKWPRYDHEQSWPFWWSLQIGEYWISNYIPANVYALLTSGRLYCDMGVARVPEYLSLSEAIADLAQALRKLDLV